MESKSIYDNQKTLATHPAQGCYTDGYLNPNLHGLLTMEQVDLQRFEITGLLGSGADYEVRAAVDRETGQQVVLKRPVPQAISRQMHGPIEGRTDRTLDFYREVGSQIAQLSPIVGYSERANHDGYYGDAVQHEYRVLVVARAHGIPLAGDVRARILRVPIGLGQNLFSLFPLPFLDDSPAFAVQQQLLDMQEQFYQAGYILLDLGPQNIFYQPASRSITIIDSGDLVAVDEPSLSRSRQPRDIHDFFLEVIKYYTTPAAPPENADGYRDSRGVRPVITLEQEMDEIGLGFSREPGPASTAAMTMIEKVRSRSYGDFGEFRRDLTGYLEEARIRNRSLPNQEQARQGWRDAMQLLHADYWRRFVFDPETELAAFDDFS